MNAEIATLRTRLDDIDKRDADYKEQVARLRKVLDQATALLTRNSADVGAKAAKAETDIAELQGRIEELAHAAEQRDQRDRQNTDDRTRLETRIAALEQTQTKIVDKVAPTLPDDKEQLWTQAGVAARGRPARRRTAVLPGVHPALPRRSARAAGLPGDRPFVRRREQVPERRGRVPEGARDLSALARGARGDVAALVRVRAAALLHRRALAAVGFDEALPEVAARRRRQVPRSSAREAAQGRACSC